MTIDKDRKRSIRERMAKTGESYVVARMHESASQHGRGVPSTPQQPADLTEEEREDLAALWVEIRMKHDLVPPELAFEPFLFGIGVSSMAEEWPGKKEFIADLEARMKALGQRLASQGDAAIREWFMSRDRPDAEIGSVTPKAAALDEALLGSWLDLRKLISGKEVVVAPGAPLLAHELATFGDPRAWREMRPVLRRTRRLMADRVGSAGSSAIEPRSEQTSPQEG